jgi:hypothetical protein
MFQEVWMVSRIRLVPWFAVLLSLITSSSALAKGGFDYIAVTGADLETEIRFTDRVLTADFFAFADFYEDRTGAPADPGEGYEITRFYMNGARGVIFDRLHYYPGTGYVFYDGIENGESEYDGEWYIARPEIKPLFEAALAAQEKQLAAPVSGVQGESAGVPPAPVQMEVQQLPLFLLAGGLAALTALATLAFRRRRPAPDRRAGI